jgi:hypothetical protein
MSSKKLIDGDIIEVTSEQVEKMLDGYLDNNSKNKEEHELHCGCKICKNTRMKIRVKQLYMANKNTNQICEMINNEFGTDISYLTFQKHIKRVVKKGQDIVDEDLEKSRMILEQVEDLKSGKITRGDISRELSSMFQILILNEMKDRIYSGKNYKFTRDEANAIKIGVDVMRTLQMDYNDTTEVKDVQAEMKEMIEQMKAIKLGKFRVYDEDIENISKDTEE